MLQVKFSESENVKRRPPVAIVNGSEWLFLVTLPPCRVLQSGALLGTICESRRVRDEYALRIAQQVVHGLVAGGVGVSHRQLALAQQVHGLHESPIRGDDLPGVK